MAWEDTKQDGDLILPADWNAMVTNQKSLGLIGAPQTFEDADATPTVANYRVFRTANTGSTTITNFEDGADGQEIVIQFNDSNTIIQNNATIKLQGGQNFAPAQYDVLLLSKLSTVWIEGGRSLNS